MTSVLLSVLVPGGEGASLRRLASSLRDALPEAGMVELLTHAGPHAPSNGGNPGLPVVELRDSSSPAEALTRLIGLARGRLLAFCRGDVTFGGHDWRDVLRPFADAGDDASGWAMALRPAGSGAIIVPMAFAKRVAPFLVEAAGSAADVFEGVAAEMGELVDCPGLRVDSHGVAARADSALAVRSTIGTLLRDSGLRADHAIAGLERYRPSFTGEGEMDAPSPMWPPRVACLGWNGKPAPNAIHYSRKNTRILLTSMIGNGFCRDGLFISRTMSGLPNLMWAPLFERIVSICPTVNPAIGRSEPLTDGKHRFHFGRIVDERFVHPVVRDVGELGAILLDDRRYDELCSGYFHFKRALKRPGIVIFMHATGGMPSEGGVARFLLDLARGYLDNRRHDIVTIDEDVEGRGIAYEIVE